MTRTHTYNSDVYHRRILLCQNINNKSANNNQLLSNSHTSNSSVAKQIQQAHVKISQLQERDEEHAE